MEAMSVYLRFKRSGGTREELLAEHPHLHDLLVTLLDESEDAGDDDLRDHGAPNPHVRPRTLEPGHVLGDFRLVRCLGGGGMGTVWEAEQRSLNRRVALKVLFGLGQMDVRRLARFRREAEAGGRITHPSIVAVYGVGEAEGVAYICQELVPDGLSLADRLEQRRDELSRGVEPTRRYEREVATFFAAVADAMQTAHDVQVVHRDLKPSNLLMTEDRRPKVADFGLAWVQSELAVSQSGDLVGTPYYMSPEQIRGARGEIDERTDVFSLGSTLYEALTLQRAFEGDTSVAVLHDIQVLDPRPPHVVAPWISPDVSAICMHALAKRPDDRYPNMAAFAADLRAYLSGRPVVARAPSVVERALRWARRHVILVLVSALAIAALGVSAYFLDEMRSLLGRMHDSGLVTNRLYAEELGSLADDDARYAPLVADIRAYVDENLAGLPELQLDMLEQLVGVTNGRRRSAADVATITDGLTAMAETAAGLGDGAVRAADASLRLSRFLRGRGLFEDAIEVCRGARIRSAARLGERHPLTQALEAEAALVAWHAGDFSTVDGARATLRSFGAQLRSSSGIGVPVTGSALAITPDVATTTREGRRTLADVAAALGDWDEARDLYALLITAPADRAGLREHYEIRARHALATAETGDLETAYDLLRAVRDERRAAFGGKSSDVFVDELRLHHVRLAQAETLGLLGAQRDALDALADPARGEQRSLARLDGLTDLARLYAVLVETGDPGDRLAHLDGRAAALAAEVDERVAIQSDRHPKAVAAARELQTLRALPHLPLR